MKSPEVLLLWLRTALFTLLIPATVLVWVPGVLVATGVGPRMELGKWRLAGLLPLAMGIAMILWCFVAFIRRGRGTPAPYDPPRRLVISGLYRFVRNPQYVGVVLIIIGEALVTRAAILFVYAAVLAIGYHLFVTLHEEPRLLRLFGEDYARYCQTVPRWMPGLN